MAALAKDEATSDRIVQSAAVLFAEKGYRSTTIQDICKRAGANVASVNYYFRSKENLYREVWRFCRDLVEKTHALLASADPDPMARILAQQAAALRAIFDEGPGGLFPKMIHREMMDPCPISEELRDEFIEPLRQYLHEALREVLGPSATEGQLISCEIALISPRIILNNRGPLIKKLLQAGDPTPEELEILIDSLSVLIEGGIRNMKMFLNPGGEE
ncbi:MAG: TetR/AcrR family transcriptional regulator [Kiritimatiellia bacterium]|nr:TetR/AcrR family transcriptional regulator [Kiritimatiellia bacterium]